MNALFQTPPTIALFTPLKVLWCWISQADLTRRYIQPHQPVVQRTNHFATSGANRLRRVPASHAIGALRTSSPQKPLRVLRVLEAGQKPSQMGRIRITGRMADVCAELDRLAAFETA
jgi:hypothetical protein